jgi:hypothetical protein
MTTAGPQTSPPGSKARTTGPATVTTKIFEWLGLLNTGSSQSPPTPNTEEATKTTGVSTNSLNVTRVGGFAAFIAAAGAAALAVFNVNKATDKPAIVVAAYISVGVIIAAALFTAAIVISTDIRSRVTMNLEPSLTNLAPSSTTVSATGTKAFDDAWKQALDVLKGIHTRLQHKTEDPLDAWLDGSATSAVTEQLHPTDDRQTDHARLQACQSRVLSKLEGLIGENDHTKIQNTQDEIQVILDNMERILQS